GSPGHRPAQSEVDERDSQLYDDHADSWVSARRNCTDANVLTAEYRGHWRAVHGAGICRDVARGELLQRHSARTHRVWRLYARPGTDESTSLRQCADAYR